MLNVTIKGLLAHKVRLATTAIAVLIGVAFMAGTLVLTVFMQDGPVWNFASAQDADTERYGELFRHLLERGVYVAPSQFEGMFVSTAHGPVEVERTVDAARELLGA